MTTIVLPDTAKMVRDWLRSISAVTTLVSSSRIDIAASADTANPSIIVRRVGGGDDDGEAPIDQALVQIDIVSGSTPSRAAVLAIVGVVRGEIKALRTATVGNLGVLYGGSVDSDVWLPDPSNDRPRQILTAAFTARAA